MSIIKKINLRKLLEYIKRIRLSNQFEQQLEFVRKTGAFDEQYYLKHNKDAIPEGEEPLHHFMRVGWKEGRNPNASFDFAYYREHYEDLSLLNENLFLHYLHFGKSEGRLAKGFFERNTDSLSPIIKGNIDSLSEGVLKGWAFNYANPEASLELYILDEQGRKVGYGYADILREDLKKEGMGSGKHGFDINIDHYLFDGEEHSLSLQAVDGEQIVNTNSFTFSHKINVVATIKGLKGYSVFGIVETSETLNQNPVIQIFVDGNFVATGDTNYVETQYHFEVQLPSKYFDGYPHIIQASIKGSPTKHSYYLDILSYNQTSWDYLQRSYQHKNYAALSRTAGYRYESLRFHQKHSHSLPEHLHNAGIAHEIVVEGHRDRMKYTKLTLPTFENPKVSIIIPAYKNFPTTYHCIASIILAFNEAHYEVIVIDDNSGNETEQLYKYLENVQLITNDTNLGFLRSCNKAAGKAKGDYLVFLNNDTEVTTGWIDELLETFFSRPKVGLVGSKLIYPDGTLQEAGGIVWQNGQPWNIGKGENANHPQYNYTREVDYVSGASIMILKTLWDELGGFSEEFAPAYYEDTDLAFKIREAGYKTLYCPFSEVIHFEGMSSGRDVKSGVKRFQKINAPKFRKKWFEAYQFNGIANKKNVHLNMDRNVHYRYRALVIDYTTPMPDHDAGAYAAVQEMKLLISLGCKLTFAPENLAHLGKYTEDLQRLGIECVYSPHYISIEQVFQELGQEFDLVYITRFDVAKKYISLTRNYTRAKILFNNADLHFLRELRSALAQNETDLSGPLSTRDQELGIMREVDAILSYNEAEHAVIESHNLRNDNIFRCPWILTPHPPKSSFSEREGLAFLGGFRHLPNLEAMKYFAESIMPELSEVLPEVTLYIYGSNTPDELHALESENIVVKGFAESLEDVFEGCRVFVTPLLSGAGIKGKVLDAISYGVPSVLSPVAAEATGISHGTHALIAEDTQDWVKYIQELYYEEKLWNKVSQNALKLAQERYSFSKGRAQMQKALEFLEIYTLTMENP